MTSDINIGSLKGIKPNAIVWSASVSQLTDTCTITLPLAVYTSRNSAGTFMPGLDNIGKVPFSKGDKVSVSVGYGDKKNKVFEGFVHRVNKADRLVIECEGFAYCLRDKFFSKSYLKTSVRQLLSDLVYGTEIEVSPATDNIPLSNVWFKNASATKVLEFLQKECCCKVFFDGHWLYAGASKFILADPARKNETVSLKAGYNVIETSELEQSESENVRIEISERDSAGKVKKTSSEQKRYSSIREVKVRRGLPQDFLRKAVKEMQQAENYSGFEGNVTLFLEPSLRKGDNVFLSDSRFPERSGHYFVESVEGSFSEQGGRQKVNLKWYGQS